MNYVNTLIAVAPDCPVTEAVPPPRRGTKASVAQIQFELLSNGGRVGPSRVLRTPDRDVSIWALHRAGPVRLDYVNGREGVPSCIGGESRIITSVARSIGVLRKEIERQDTVP